MLFAGLKTHHLTEEHVLLGEFLVAILSGPSRMEDNRHNLVKGEEPG